eukprot:XP_011661138.1 PREDICTED: uncharacterized protein LOC576791 isoform X2 [Strongylocentrotus purpuratus]
MIDNVLYDSYSNQKSPAQTGNSMTYATVPDYRTSEEPEEGMQDNPLYTAFSPTFSPTPSESSRQRQEPPPIAPKPGNQRIMFGKPMVATTPRPTGLSVANNNTPDASPANASRPREVQKQTPVRRPLGTANARHKKREDFLKGLNKLIEASMDGSFQDNEPNTPIDKLPNKKKDNKVSSFFTACLYVK